MKNEITYFYDGGVVIACIGMGYGGMFIGKFSMKTSEDWTFITPQTISWDSIHRNIYEGKHDYDLCRDDDISLLPPLPPVPEYRRIEWWENFAPEGPILAEEFPLTAGALKNSVGGSMVVYFILEEDLYETRFGDGIFLYYHHDIFFSEESARRFAAESNKALEEDPDICISFRHLKSCTLVLDGEEIASPDWMPERSVHYRLEELVEDAESRLEQM